MKYPAYPQYKNSGVAWLDEVPAHWEVKRLKYLTSINDSALPESTNPDFEFSYIDIGSVNLVDGITATETMVFENAPSRARRVVQFGDIIVSTVRTYLRAIASIPESEETLIVSTGFAVIRPRLVESKFLSFALKEASFVENVVSRSVGVSYPAVNASEIGDIQILAPSEAEQTAIADFLDRETGRIDTLVAKKRKLVELLKEKRSALISRTVTCGLPADVAREFDLEPSTVFKHTGVEWLKEIPEGWEILPFTKYVSDKSDYRGKTPEKTDSGVFLVTARNVRMGYIDYVTSQEYVAEDDYEVIMRRGLPKLGDVLFTTEAPLGNVALVDREDVAFAQRIIRFRMNEKYFISAFTLYAMMSDHFQNQLKSLSTGSTAEGLKASKLTTLKIICPPLDEQIGIAAYLDRETVKIDRLLAKVETAITRLQEYRSALITAAVTGKIDVREYV